MPARTLFVTTALPYANAPFHIGHIMEYIQADIWVRVQRMRGAQVNFVCADDAHGAPIMIAADKAGKTPQAFVAEIAAALTENGKVGVLATPATVRSGSYVRALANEQRALTVTEVEAPDLAAVIQRGLPTRADGDSVTRGFWPSLMAVKPCGVTYFSPLRGARFSATTGMFLRLDMKGVGILLLSTLS